MHNIIRLILHLQGRMGRRRPGTTVQLECAPQMDRHHCRIRLRLHITHDLLHHGTSTLDHLPRVRHHKPLRDADDTINLHPWLRSWPAAACTSFRRVRETADIASIQHFLPSLQHWVRLRPEQWPVDCVSIACGYRRERPTGCRSLESSQRLTTDRLAPDGRSEAAP